MLLDLSMAMSLYVSADTTTGSFQQSFNDYKHYCRIFFLSTWPVIFRKMGLIPSIQELKEWAQVINI